MRGGVASVMVVLALGISGAMLGGAGFADAWGSPAPQTDAAQEELNESGGDLNPENTPVSGPVGSGDSEIVGLIASGLSSLTDLAGAVALLPWTLMSLGFPAWFAAPVGSLAYVLVGISLIEWATNREWN